MQKLRLDPESLAVESFLTLRQTDARGTVNAHDAFLITQGANTCYHCTRWGCPPTGLC